MKQLLIIDDEEQILIMLKQFFSDSGYSVKTAFDGHEGEIEYRKNPGGVIITDMYMAYKCGLALINSLKKDFPDVKIIAMTGGYTSNWDAVVRGRENVLKHATDFGASRTFTKPVDLDQLLEAVEELSE